MAVEISIIVPVYEVKNYLSVCINSILKQTYRNFELLLIDDGSKDGSGNLCDDYAKKDSRIKVYHKTNGGVSSARNLGIRSARGRWITFVDSDDILSTSFIENILKPTQNNEQINFVQAGCKKWINETDMGFHKLMEDKQGSDPYYLLNHFDGLAFSKLFKRSILIDNNIIFDENIKICEDLVFTLDYFLKSSCCYAFVKETGYYYRLDNDTSALHLYYRNKRNYEIEKYKCEKLLDKISKIAEKYNMSFSDFPELSTFVAERISTIIFSPYKLRYPRKKRLSELHDIWDNNDISILSFLNLDLVRNASLYLLRNRYYYLFDMFAVVLSILWQLKNRNN